MNISLPKRFQSTNSKYAASISPLESSDVGARASSGSVADPAPIKAGALAAASRSYHPVSTTASSCLRRFPQRRFPRQFPQLDFVSSLFCECFNFALIALIPSILSSLDYSFCTRFLQNWRTNPSQPTRPFTERVWFFNPF